MYTNNYQPGYYCSTEHVVSNASLCQIFMICESQTDSASEKVTISLTSGPGNDFLKAFGIFLEPINERIRGLDFNFIY